MRKSPGLRLVLVGTLTLLMYVPTFFISEIINERADYNRETLERVGQDWGGAQLFSGPVLVVPVEQTRTVRERRAVRDPVTGAPRQDDAGQALYTEVEVERTFAGDPLYIYPDRFEAMVDTAVTIRSRGIFGVPVFRADARFDFSFTAADAARILKDGEEALWDAARIEIYLSSNRALREAEATGTEGKVLALEPLARGEGHGGGLVIATGDPRGQAGYAVQLGFNGAHRLSFAPVGRNSEITLRSDWPHPSFSGAFLPDARTLAQDGFEARWVIPHLAQAIPQVARNPQDATARKTLAFGVDYYQPNDIYQKSYRAAHYGVLFIGLTFLAIFLIEGRQERQAHPVQYLLVGLAQSVFFLLLLSLAEQIGFGRAYLAASAATILLVAAYGWVGLALGRRSSLLGLVLGLLYGVLYLILRSADFALLAGSLLAFSAIAGTMFATRGEDWSSLAGGPRRRWFRPAATPPTTSRL